MMAKRDVQEFDARISSLETQVTAGNLDNFVRRELYSKVELLRLDIETTCAGRNLSLSSQQKFVCVTMISILI
jgi:hypothetical protein